MTTLLLARQGLAYALDDLSVYGVSAGTTSTVTSPLLVNSLSGASTKRFDGTFLYINNTAAAGQQRNTVLGSYVPSTGTLGVTPIWTTTPTAGANLEVTRLFPSIQESLGSGQVGYRDLILKALRYLTVVDHIDLTSVADQQSYSLSAYAAWLSRPERVLQVLDPPRYPAWPRRVTYRRWLVELDGGTPTLRFADRAYRANGFTFQLTVRRPGWSLVNGAESASGPSADSDIILPEIEEIVTVGLACAYEALANRTPGQPSGPWVERAASQWALARSLANFDETVWRAERSAPAVDGREN